MARRKRSKLEIYGEPVVGQAVKGLIRVLRLASLEGSANFCGAAMRRIGPLLPEHRIGQANLRAAFPEKDEAWIEATLRGAWETTGRTAGEYVHLGELWDFDPEHPNTGRIVTEHAQRLADLRDDGKPALLFAAHLSNFELPAVAAAAHGLDSAVLYRMPNNKAVAHEIERIRRPLMGKLIRGGMEATFEMAAALERGQHVGMLVDQHFGRGVEVTFFGRRCKANPTIARLARQFDCPVLGVRVVSLPDRRYFLEATDPLDLPRDANGQVDVPATMQMITSQIEAWIREYPEQWLWFHRRWR
jgi:KDO2-lipid IV(A) lauroyltransferase